MKKNYEEMETYAGDTIEETVKRMLSYKEEGKLVYATFNGHTLYSDIVTIDSAYKKITGKTYDEFVKDEEKRKERYKKEKEEYQAKIPQLIEYWKVEGRKVLEKDKIEFWDKIIPTRLVDIYRGLELGQSLEVIKILNNNGTFEEAKEIVDKQGHSGMSMALLSGILRCLCDRGEEFATFLLLNNKSTH